MEQSPEVGVGTRAVETAGLSEELLWLRREVERLRRLGAGASVVLTDELLGLELAHEYNTRSS